MPNNSHNSELNFEEKLWSAADKLRGSMDASDYKYVVLGLIFLKYISDTFEEAYNEIKNDKEAYVNEWEDKEAYTAKNVFWVPQVSRWNFLKENAKKPEIGELIDAAMLAIEKENPSLKGVLLTNFARPTLDKRVLGELVDLISDIGLGDAESRKKDILGRVYEYFLGKFANAEGKAGGEFYTPKSIVKLLVSMIEPFNGRVYDPCCGSGGMFVQSEDFVKAHGGRVGDLSIYGQEINNNTWKLCKINLAIRGIEADIKWNSEGSFHNDAFKDLKADYILANPPFNLSDWGGGLLRNDIRWKYGLPPTGNANYAWIQHFIHHLSPTGIAGFVMANGALGSNQIEEKNIKEKLVNAGLIDCVVALPPKLFYTTPVSASLWILSRDRYDHKYRDRHNEVLFIDAQKLGRLIEDDRNHKELREEDIARIINTYHGWRNIDGGYKDEINYCRRVPIEEIIKNDFVLIPGRYIEVSGNEDGVNLANKIQSDCLDINDIYQKSLGIEKELSDLLKKYKYVDEDIKFSVAQTETLEEIGKTLFRSWFVDFDFPEEGNYYKSNGGLLTETSNGKIPQNWHWGSLSELMDIKGGTQPPASQFSEQKLDGYIRLVQIRDFDTESHLTYIPKTSKLRICSKEDIMIARYGAAVGRILYGLEGAYNVALVKVVPVEEYYTEYLRYYLKSDEFQNRLKSMSGRSAQSGFNKTDIASFVVPIAPKEVYVRFNEITKLLMKKVLINKGWI